MQSPIKVKGHPLLDLLQKQLYLSSGSFIALFWWAPQASLGKSSHCSSQAGHRHCPCFPYSQLTQHPTNFGWFVAAPHWLVFALCSNSVNYDTSGSSSLFWTGSPVPEGESSLQMWLWHSLLLSTQVCENISYAISAGGRLNSVLSQRWNPLSWPV